jgi:hypothetical protein
MKTLALVFTLIMAVFFAGIEKLAAADDKYLISAIFEVFLIWFMITNLTFYFSL